MINESILHNKSQAYKTVKWQFSLCSQKRHGIGKNNGDSQHFLLFQQMCRSHPPDC